MDTLGGQVVLQQKALQTTLRRAIDGCACAVQYIHVEFAALTCLIGWGRSAPERFYPHCPLIGKRPDHHMKLVSEAFLFLRVVLKAKSPSGSTVTGTLTETGAACASLFLRVQAYYTRSSLVSIPHPQKAENGSRSPVSGPEHLF